MIKLERAYDKPAASSGYRVLVDRLWPRGVSKQELKLDEWLKEVGPSTSLRKWFNHDPTKWPEFKKRYQSELNGNPAFDHLKQLAKDQVMLTLVYGSADTEHNQAVALKEFLQ